MKLAIKAYIVTLILLTLVFAVSAQKRSDKDPRNTAPTVGTGGPIGGPTGLFTVYDGQTLRKGEYTFSFAYSNYDRDPGNVDITETPLSFQIGVTNNLEFFFNTNGFRGVKVNSPRNLSGFYLPNSQVMINGSLTSAPAIILAPSGPGSGSLENLAIFRPTGSQPFVQFPFMGGGSGSFGTGGFVGPLFGFGAGTNPTLGPPVTTNGNTAAAFPGIGSAYGSILPGIVLSTGTITGPGGTQEVPTVFTVAPSYLPDAPFINRRYGTSSFNALDFGVKWRMNNVESPIGYGLIASYRWYLDQPDSYSGFNMLQRGASPGGNRGDINLTFFADARLSEHINMSGNIGYTYVGNPRDTFGGTDYTALDRPDEIQASVGVDFPVNKYLQYIFEFRSLQYVGGRTPNALERNPLDGLAGIRIFPRRWFGFGAAYRYNFNQQDRESFDENNHSTTVVVGGTTATNTFNGLPTGFDASSSPSGFIGQFWVGRREPRAVAEVNKPANVDSVTLSSTTVTLPCPAGTKSRSGQCNDNSVITVTTRASDPENDVLTYHYTASGGRVIGSTANVQWDMAGVRPGTYTLTTGVDDGCGVCGKTNTQTITVQECPDCGPTCSCPTLSVNGPSGITQPGSPMTFSANASGGTGDVTYNWTVSAGTISSGQGTSSITVDTTGLSNTNVTATVDIGGTDPECHCTTTASDTGSIAGSPTPNQVDEFGKATADDVKARVDNFYIQLNNNPTAQGYIINYGTPAEIKARRTQITKAISFRKYDASRVTFVDGPDTGSGVNTKFIIVPPGATPPAP